MAEFIANITLLVKDYDEAIDFYTSILQFELIEDTPLSETKRWVRIRPKGSSQTCLLLAKAKNEKQKGFIGNQTGNRVFLFLHTDDFDAYYERLIKQNVSIVRPASQEEYGKVAVFSDLYGNLWDLVEK